MDVAGCLESVSRPNTDSRPLEFFTIRTHAMENSLLNSTTKVARYVLEILAGTSFDLFTILISSNNNKKIGIAFTTDSRRTFDLASKIDTLVLL